MLRRVGIAFNRKADVPVKLQDARMNRCKTVAYTSASLTRLSECANLTDSRGDSIGILFSYCDATVLSGFLTLCATHSQIHRATKRKETQQLCLRIGNRSRRSGVSYKFSETPLPIEILWWQYQRHRKNSATRSTCNSDIVDTSLIRDISKILIVFGRFPARSCTRKLPLVKYEAKTDIFQRSLLYYL